MNRLCIKLQHYVNQESSPNITHIVQTLEAAIGCHWRGVWASSPSIKQHLCQKTIISSDLYSYWASQCSMSYYILRYNMSDVNNALINAFFLAKRAILPKRCFGVITWPLLFRMFQWAKSIPKHAGPTFDDGVRECCPAQPAEAVMDGCSFEHLGVDDKLGDLCQLAWRLNSLPVPLNDEGPIFHDNWISGKQTETNIL